MGIYLIKADFDFIKNSVDDFLKAEGFKQDDRIETEGKIQIFAKGKTKGIDSIISTKWLLTQLKEHVSVQIEVIPDRISRFAAIFNIIILAICLPISAWMTHSFLSTKHLKAVHLFLPLVLIFCAFYYAALSYICGKILKKVETSFKNYIRKGISVRIKSPFEVDLIPTWAKIVVSSSFFLSSCYLASILSYFILLLLLIISALLFFNIFLSKLTEKNPYLIWKRILMDYIMRWTNLNFVIIVFFAGLMSFVMGEFYSYEKDTKKNPIHINEITKMAVFKEFMSLDYKDIFPFRRKILKEAIDNRFNEIKKDISWPLRVETEREACTRFFFGKPGEAMFLLISTSLLIMLVFLVHLLRVPQDWKIAKAETSFVSMKPPSIAGSRDDISKYFHSVILVMFFFFGIINYISAFLSLESLSYLITNNTIFLKEISSLLHWIPTSFSFGAMDLSYAGEMKYLFYTKSFLLLVASPFLVLLTVYLWIFLKKGLVIKNKGSVYFFPSKELNSFLISNCKKLDIEPPRVIITHSDIILIESTLGLLSRRATVYINKEILDLLSEDELKAVIAHELAHIKYDLKKTALLRFFSRIALFPNYYLLLLMNYREMELNADMVAILMMKNKAALENVLKKLAFYSRSKDIYNTFMEEKPQKSKLFTWIHNYKKWINIFNDFFAKDALIGYTYPEISERIKSIEGISTYNVFKEPEGFLVKEE